MQIKVSNFTRGRSYWKMNNSLLKDGKYLEMMNKYIDDHIHQATAFEKDPSSTWESLKIGIKSQSIQYSVTKQNTIEKQERDREDRLRTLTAQLALSPNNTNLVKEVEQIKMEGEIYALHKARGAQVRSKIKWIEEGEKKCKTIS